MIAAFHIKLKRFEHNSIHGVFSAPLGSLDCTRKFYVPLCRGKFALSESTASKFGKIFIFPLYYLIHFSR